jgi:hypothetical protein
MAATDIQLPLVDYRLNFITVFIRHARECEDLADQVSIFVVIFGNSLRKILLQSVDFLGDDFLKFGLKLGAGG